MTPQEYNAKIRKILPSQKAEIDNLAKVLALNGLAKDGLAAPVPDEFLDKCVKAHIRTITALLDVAKDYLNSV